MDVFHFVCWVVETNGLSLLSFLPHFQPDPFLFPLSLPFRPSSSPPLSRVEFLQSSAWVLPSVACALTLLCGSGSGGSKTLAETHCSPPGWLTDCWRDSWVRKTEQDYWQTTEHTMLWIVWHADFSAQNENMWVTQACVHRRMYCTCSGNQAHSSNWSLAAVDTAAIRSLCACEPWPSGRVPADSVGRKRLSAEYLSLETSALSSSFCPPPAVF